MMVAPEFALPMRSVVATYLFLQTQGGIAGQEQLLQ